MKKRDRGGLSLIELVIALAVLAVVGTLGAVGAGQAVRDANAEALTEGVEQLAQWRSSIIATNNPDTTAFWNQGNIGCGDGNPSCVPKQLNEGKPMSWPVVKGTWTAVCDAAGLYQDQRRRVLSILGDCQGTWDSSNPQNSPMQSNNLPGLAI